MADYFATKFDSARDEIVSLLSDWLSGFGEYCSGDVESPTGFFEMVIIPDTIDFNNVPYWEAYVIELINDYGVVPGEIIGNWVVTTNSQGFVYVERFETEEMAREAYTILENEYVEWVGDDDL
jgi:hypothetical protein